MDGERVRRRLKELGLTSEKIAQELGTTRVTVSRWENETSEPDDKTKIALAKLLKTTVSYLLGETDEPNELPQAQQQHGTCVIDGQGNIVCMWGNKNRITLPDNIKTRQILCDFFHALYDANCISAEDIPSDILRIVPLRLPNATSNKEIAHIVQKAINEAFPDEPVRFDVVIADENMDDKKGVPSVSAYNGNNSNYSGNTLTVGVTG